MTLAPLSGSLLHPDALPMALVAAVVAFGVGFPYVPPVTAPLGEWLALAVVAKTFTAGMAAVGLIEDAAAQPRDK